jgi:hypothetical protein
MHNDITLLKDDQTEPSFSRLVRQRFSCRVYEKQPIAIEQQVELQAYMDTLAPGPFGTASRFKLVTATEKDHAALRGLGTYGFIRNATAFIIGAIQPGKKDLEDYGYLMEAIILKATGMGLGTCWLGGTFTQSSFAKRINLEDNETMPAVTSLGYIADDVKARRSLLRRSVNAEHRLPWESLFFCDKLGKPLPQTDVENYGIPLEMVRLAPSASNKQPWRVIKQDGSFHFFLQRTPGYGKGSLLFRTLRLADLQRVDMGIAMCHFELAAHSLSLRGVWENIMPSLGRPDELTEYISSWRCI